MSKFDPDELRKSIDEFKKRKIYNQLTEEIISTIPDDKIEQAIIDYIFTKITDFSHSLAIVSNMSQGFQIIYSTWILEGEVNNGGFNQYFFNSSGQFADMALRSLKNLGVYDHYAILKRAISIHIDERENQTLQSLYSQKTIEAFFESYKFSSLEECDNAFYKLETNLSAIRIQYIRAHSSEFVGD